MNPQIKYKIALVHIEVNNDKAVFTLLEMSVRTFKSVRAARMYFTRENYFGSTVKTNVDGKSHHWFRFENLILPFNTETYELGRLDDRFDNYTKSYIGWLETSVPEPEPESEPKTSALPVKLKEAVDEVLENEKKFQRKAVVADVLYTCDLTEFYSVYILSRFKGCTVDKGFCIRWSATYPDDVQKTEMFLFDMEHLAKLAKQSEGAEYGGNLDS